MFKRTYIGPLLFLAVDVLVVICLMLAAQWVIAQPIEHDYTQGPYLLDALRKALLMAIVLAGYVAAKAHMIGARGVAWQWLYADAALFLAATCLLRWVVAPALLSALRAYQHTLLLCLFALFYATFAHLPSWLKKRT